MKNINGVEVLDTIDEILRPGHTALLVIDVQNDFCHPEGHFARYGKALGSVQAMLPALVNFVAAAQGLGIFTAFICQQTLPHGRSDSPAWLRFKCRDGKSPEYTLKGSWGAELVEGLAPTARDVSVEKFRPDAFLRTALDAILRSQGIESLVLAELKARARDADRPRGFVPRLLRGTGHRPDRGSQRGASPELAAVHVRALSGRNLGRGSRRLAACCSPYFEVDTVHAIHSRQRGRPA